VVLVGCFAAHWSAYLVLAILPGFLLVVLAVPAGTFAYRLFAQGSVDRVELPFIIMSGTMLLAGWWAPVDDDEDIHCLRETITSALSGTDAA